MSKPTILIDQDEVLVQWGTGFTRWFRDAYPGVDFIPGEERLTFDMFLPEEAHIHDKIQSVMNAPGFYESLEPVDGAADALSDMLDAGYDVAIVTSPWLANPTCASAKFASLDGHFGKGMSKRAIITSDKTRVIGDYLIDDKPEIHGSQKPVWEHILFAAPHNDYVEDAIRLNGWGSWRTVIEELEAR